MDEVRRKLPAPVTTTEEFLHAAVVELQALTAAVEQLVQVLSTVPGTVELVADGDDWPETVELVEGAEQEAVATEEATAPAPKKSRKKVAAE